MQVSLDSNFATETAKRKDATSSHVVGLYKQVNKIRKHNVDESASKDTQAAATATNGQATVSYTDVQHYSTAGVIDQVCCIVHAFNFLQ